MGIPKFFGYLTGQNTKKKGNCIDVDKLTLGNKQYDYLFLDYQSLCYSSISVFSGEINYFIRLANYIKNKAEKNENVYTQNRYILEYILAKYLRYFRVIKAKKPSFPMNFPELNGTNKFTLDSIKSFMNEILGAPLNTEQVVWDELVNQVIDLTKSMADIHVKSDKKFCNTYIFFDGVPTLAKVREQLSRRVYPEVISTIKSNLYDESIAKDKSFMTKTITGKLLSTSAPIGVDTYVVNKLRTDLALIEDEVKGKFFINERLKYGEAEHQLMKYLSNHLNIFSEKKILLGSPDADLILLALISSTKGISIDILRTNGIDDKNYKFYQKMEVQVF